VLSSGDVPVDLIVATQSEKLVSSLAELVERENSIRILRLFSSAEELRHISRSAKHAPDVVVIDLGFLTPACPAPSGQRGNATIVVLPPYATVLELGEATRVEPGGLVGHDDAPEEIAAAVQAVFAGKAWVSPALVGGLLRLAVAAYAGPDVDTRPQRTRLTAREVAVLHLVAEGIPNARIADQLRITERTVKHHMATARRKLHARDRAHLVALSFRTGVLSVNCSQEQCVSSGISLTVDRVAGGRAGSPAREDI
jgi:DNA-binding NarL/FixJ family response regulator